MNLVSFYRQPGRGAFRLPDVTLYNKVMERAMADRKRMSGGGMMRSFIVALAAFVAIGHLRGADSASEDATVFDAFKGKVYAVALKPAAISDTTVNSWTGDSLTTLANGYATFTVTFAAKGRARVKGSLPDGSNVSLSSKLTVEADGCRLPVVYAKKSSLAFQMLFDSAGNFRSIVGLTEWKGDGFTVTWDEDVKVSAAGNHVGESYFNLVDSYPMAIEGAAVVKRLMPINVPVADVGSRWTVPKKAQVKLASDGTLTYGDNPADIKLTNTEKTGAFKGRFSFYTSAKGRLRKKSASVSGVVVDGVGYGTATVKKVGSWPVKIEAKRSSLSFDASSDPIKSSIVVTHHPGSGTTSRNTMPEKKGTLSLAVNHAGSVSAVFRIDDDETDPLMLSGTMERSQSDRSSILSLGTKSGGWLRFNLSRSVSGTWSGLGTFGGEDVCKVLKGDSEDGSFYIKLKVSTLDADEVDNEFTVSLSGGVIFGDRGSMSVMSQEEMSAAEMMDLNEDLPIESMLTLSIATDGTVQGILSIEATGDLPVFGTLEKRMSGFALSLKTVGDGWMQFNLFPGKVYGWTGSGTLGGMDIIGRLYDGSDNGRFVVKTDVILRRADGTETQDSVDVSILMDTDSEGRVTVVTPDDLSADVLSCLKEDVSTGSLSIVYAADGATTAMLRMDDVGNMQLSGTLEKGLVGSVLTLNASDGSWIRLNLFQGISDRWMGTGLFGGADICRILGGDSAGQTAKVWLEVSLLGEDGTDEGDYLDLAIQMISGDSGSMVVSPSDRNRAACQPEASASESQTESQSTSQASSQSE